MQPEHEGAMFAFSLLNSQARCIDTAHSQAVVRKPSGFFGGRGSAASRIGRSLHGVLNGVPDRSPEWSIEPQMSHSKKQPQSRSTPPHSFRASQFPYRLLR